MGTTLGTCVSETCCEGCCECCMTNEERMLARERRDRVKLREDEQREAYNARAQARRNGSVPPTAGLMWSCPACTLQNNQITPQCDACGTRRPTASAQSTPTPAPARFSSAVSASAAPQVSVVVVRVPPQAPAVALTATPPPLAPPPKSEPLLANDHSLVTDEPAPPPYDAL